MTDPNDPANDGANQSLIEHLLELRKRLLRIVAAVFGVFALLMLTTAYRYIYDWVAAPLMNVLPANTSMIATHVTSPFLVPMELALYVSIMVTMPYILHQIWAFVSPGLYQREKKLTAPLLASSVVLFYVGCAFAYFVIFPILFKFFTTIAPEGVSVMTDIGNYLSFVMRLFIAFGVVFELPVFIVLLVGSGLVKRATLADKRRHVFVGCFIVAMFITPPDMFSQTLLAIPMYLLYEIGLFFTRNMKAEKEADAEAPDDNKNTKPTNDSGTERDDENDQD